MEIKIGKEMYKVQRLVELPEQKTVRAMIPIVGVITYEGSLVDATKAQTEKTLTKLIKDKLK
jgi:hypothetical protein